MDINKHIVDNLNYYLQLSSPEYAFLLSGEWGVGKTHFIDEYIEKTNNEVFRLIKISLFGLKNISDVDAIIFQKLHPILGSKTAKLMGNVIKGAISMGVKLDIDSSGTPETTITTKFDKLEDIAAFFSNKKNKEVVLVFDDLERNDISIVEVLGFINGLVENSKVKVILIANEKAITDSDKGNIYKDFKEKVIGKTFEVKHNFDAVLSDFLKGYSLVGHEDLIKDVYTRSTLKNLRKFKQSINDFEYLIKNIYEKYKDNKQFHKDLVRCFFALSIEIKKGSLSEIDLRKDMPFMKGAVENKTINDIYKKYFVDQSHLYDGDTWADILFKGDISNINEETSKLALFAENTEQDRPNWVKLWNFRELEDGEFSNLIKTLETELNDLTENDLRIYFHKLALIIYFSKNGLSKISISDIENIVGRYTKKYESSIHWKTVLVKSDSFHDGTGYGYICEQDQDFNNLKSLILSKKEQVFNEEKQKEKIAELNQFVENIKSGSRENIINFLLSTYQFQPILHKVETKTFVDALMLANNSTIGILSQVIHERYSTNDFFNGREKYLYLKEELSFWINVKEYLNHSLSDKSGLKAHILNSFLNYTVSKTIERLS